MQGIPSEILRAYGLAPNGQPIDVGLINQTFEVERNGQPLICQRLHPLFGAQVHEDILAVTEHVNTACRAQGISDLLPTLVRNQTGALYTLDAEQGVWRVFTFIEGVTYTHVSEPLLAFGAGKLAGGFHRLTRDLQVQFRHVRPGVHDLGQHLGRLAAAASRSYDPSVGLKIDDARALAHAIAAAATHLPVLKVAGECVLHGDLKISNLRFGPSYEGVALLDLDTMQHGQLAHEMGDALRSWCNPGGEDAARVHVDPELLAHALRGYRAGNPTVSADDLHSFVDGLEVIALELASRFALDVFENRYFGWNAKRFGSRPEHNLVRARAQLALSLDVRARRSELHALVDACMSKQA